MSPQTNYCGSIHFVKAGRTSCQRCAPIEKDSLLLEIHPITQFTVLESEQKIESQVQKCVARMKSQKSVSKCEKLSPRSWTEEIEIYTDIKSDFLLTYCALN
jgi:hypothetical protein